MRIITQGDHERLSARVAASLVGLCMDRERPANDVYRRIQSVVMSALWEISDRGDSRHIFQPSEN